MFDINSQYGRIAISCNFIAISYRFIFVIGKPLSSSIKIMMNKKLDAKILTEEFQSQVLHPLSCPNVPIGHPE
jgi:hypothetical protein